MKGAKNRRAPSSCVKRRAGVCQAGQSAKRCGEQQAKVLMICIKYSFDRLG
jgi:hypothetical protein